MKKVMLLIIIVVATLLVQAQKPFASFKDASWFLLKRVEYLGKPGNSIYRPVGIPGTVLISVSIKDGRMQSWKSLYATDTSLIAGVKRAIHESTNLWAFITKQTTLIIPFYFDNSDDVSYVLDNYNYDPVLKIVPSLNEDFVVMKTIPYLIHVSI